MSIRLECPECGKQYRVGDDKAGGQIACKECLTPISIPNDHEADALSDDQDFDIDDYVDYVPTPRRRLPKAQSEYRPQAPRKLPKKKKQRPKREPLSNDQWRGIIGAVIVLTIATFVGSISRLLDTTTAYQKRKNLTSELADQFEEMASAMESIHDQKSARLAAARINAAIDRGEELAEEKDHIPGITPVEEAQLVLYFDKRLEVITPRMRSARTRSQQIIDNSPEMLAALLRLARIGEEYGRPGKR